MTETALLIPDEVQSKADLQAINKFQEVAQKYLIKDQDYGVIPGTKKPTLLKPGAEKITKLLGLCEHYEILEKTEDWKVPFFRYLVKCQLIPARNLDMVVTEGFGECNSMESKYRYRWLWGSELPANFNRQNAGTRTIIAKGAKTTQYRVANDDIYSQVNTIIKMAKKRALVDAALSAGRLSNVFTQDIEDIGVEKSKSASDKEQKETLTPKNNLDMDWLRESLESLNWADVGKWLKKKYGVTGPTVSAAVAKLTQEQAGEFVKEVQRRIDAARTQEEEQEALPEE